MQFSEQLKSQLNIVDVLGQYLRLKKQGTRYVGLCPFHSEKTPSFSVSPALQIYKCFGCGEAGDVFKFVMEHDQLTFPEAIKVLAEREGIPVPERQRSDDPETQRREGLMEMHEIAAEVFQNNLRGPAGKEALAYLAKRGVSAQSIAEFRLGLSDGSGQQLTQRLQKFGNTLLENSGLVGKREGGGGFYDTFRSRLMFPIHNESGKVIAFGGRAMRAEEKAKYINSPETAIYKKSQVLYNLHRAKMAARKNDRFILVEGYMDVIGVYSAGLQEVVASSGTSLSSDQVRSMKRQISQQQASRGQVILNFDPDAAGVRSTEKYIGAMIAEGLRVKVLSLPGGLDPDEFIQQHGAEAYAKAVKEAGSYFHWLADRAREKFDMRSPEGRVDAFQYLMPVLQLVHDRVERGAIANDLAEYMNVDRDTVRANLKARSTEPAPKKRSLPATVPPNERLLVLCLLNHAEARLVIRQYLTRSQLLLHLELRPIFEAWLGEDDGETFSVSRVSEKLDSRMQSLLSELSFSDLGISEEDASHQVLHCLEELETAALERSRNHLKQQIKHLEQAGNFAEAMRLAEQLNRHNPHLNR